MKKKNYINKGFKSPIKEIYFDKVEYENLKAKSREKSPVRKFIFEDDYNKDGNESVIEIIQSFVKEKDKSKKKQDQVISMKEEEKINNLILLDVKKKMKKNLNKMK